MKIEKLTDNKIRIIIKIEEFLAHNISLAKLLKEENTNALMQMILLEAEKQVGFDVKDSKLIIETFSSNEEYIVFTITKYKNELTNRSSFKKNAFYKKHTSLSNIVNMVYKFNSFEEFCNFCTYCSNAKLGDLKTLAKNISLYEYKNFYYLVFSKINYNFANYSLFENSILEFSKLISNSDVFKSTLDEYGHIIFKSNAIKNGIKYFAIK